MWEMRADKWMEKYMHLLLYSSLLLLYEKLRHFVIYTFDGLASVNIIEGVFLEAEK